MNGGESVRSRRCPSSPRPEPALISPRTGEGDHVAPLLGSQPRVPWRRCPLGLYRSVRLPEAGRRGQVDPHHEFSSLRGRRPAGTDHWPSRSRQRRSMSSGSTRTAMPSPTSPIRCASRLPRTGARRRRCAASRACSRPGRATVGGFSPRACRSRRGGRRAVTEAGDHRLFVGRRSDPFFFDVQGVLQGLQVHRRRFLRRQGHLQRRLGGAQLGAGVEDRLACGSAR